MGKYEESSYIYSNNMTKVLDGKGIYLEYNKAMDRILEVPKKLDEIELASKQGLYKLMDKQKLDASQVRECGKLI